ncbi:MAG: SMP-30/gluconolactonase/LRE family protein [Prosthecobacter sp.]|jgi:gluconolactonase|uniref:SMP-30/gluconolactonase/LRE family protein n=1 Tax=Prosthecobacter sp. TaxID=1965333 RepID=UPI0019EB62C9|nr:SMP-30/gluconolactonase/LRE family protein [Prosthecobacter sp.]MBE2282704.1 SMP-30/gluconolactonase/LRE family protein [Prosthecobacter sp.]
MKHTLLILSLLVSTSLAQDTSLHDYLVEGEPWKEAAGGFTFTDGLCCDKEGNLFFTDVKAGKGIYMLDVATGKTDLFLDNLPGISGLQIGPDGRFYACHNKEQRIIAITMKGEVEVLLTGVKCNDLVVSKTGNLYFTETPTLSVHLITKDKKHVVADAGKVQKPNGITISPDERTLVVSEHGGKHVWAWRIEDDGTLTGGEPFMTMWLPVGKETASGDGATTEANGRFFVTTELGVQIFDPAGRLAGIITKPTPESKVVSVEFAGKDHDVLYIAAGDKIFGRKVKVKGYF